MSDYLTDEERELKRLAEAATPGPWFPWCDHQPSLEWLCNDKDGVSIVTLGEDGFPAVCIADADVERTEEESASWTATPANKPVVAANVSYIAAANPKAVLALLARIEALEKAKSDWSDYADDRERLWRAWAEGKGLKDAEP